MNNDSLVKSFISKYANTNFFVNIIKLSLYPADFGKVSITGTNSFIQYVRKFINELKQKSKQLGLSNTRQIELCSKLTFTILNIREENYTIINYDNIGNYLTLNDLASQKILQQAVDDRIEDIDEFRQLTNEIVNNIHIYYEIENISASLVQLDMVRKTAQDENNSILDVAKTYKDAIIGAYSDLSKLSALSKTENLSDYYVINDEKSCLDLSKSIVQYISTGYNFYKTGFELFDRYVEGFESSSVHLISAPSNHGKSIFMVNLCRSIIEHNLDSFEEGDTILFLTLEDDIYKLSRRFSSIFGNYKSDVIKELWNKSREVVQIYKMMNTENDLLLKNMEKIYQQLFNTSIISVTKGNVSLVIKHNSENTFSPGDLGRFIDTLRIEGLNVRMVFADYVDCLIPEMRNKYSQYNDYDAQGQIVQEFRTLSRNYKIPIITATQNTRASENLSKVMSNQDVGDSYKKVRYSDFIYMCRMREDLSPLSEEVRKDVFDLTTDDDNNSEEFDETFLAEKIRNNIVTDLIPFEVKITKSKDSTKNVKRFSLFCNKNLRIYNKISEYLADAPLIENNSKFLRKDINTLSSMAVSNVAADNIDVFASNVI